CVGECICPSPGKGCGCGRSSPASMVTMQCRPTSRHLRPSGSMSPDSGGARFDGEVKRTARRRHGSKLAHYFLPKPRILHPWPSERFAVKHPRWEPYAGKPHVRFWCSEASCHSSGCKSRQHKESSPCCSDTQRQGG